eukprot:Opistho-2@61610
MRLISVVAVVLLASACVALPVRRREAPAGWTPSGSPSDDELVTLTFALKQQNLDWLESKFWSVSNPLSRDYGKHMTAAEIAAVVRPTDKAVDAVTAFIASYGIREFTHSIGKDYIIVKSATVATATKMFSAEFANYKHTTGRRAIRALDYSIPEAIAEHVDMILGLGDFPVLVRLAHIAQGKKTYDDEVKTSPNSINTAYNLSSAVATNPKSSQAVAAFLKQYYSPSDLAKFQKNNNIAVRDIDVVTGPNDANNAGVEAQLDVEYIQATGRNVTTWFISEAGLANDGQEDFLHWATTVLNTTNAPWVHSLSYGDVESTIDATYIQRADVEFQKLGVSGRTVLLASGDSGVGCDSNIFVPNWPASSAYVTAVGGTTIPILSSKESAWSSGGGGFSNVFPQPAFQAEAVAAYLASGVAPDAKFFNKTGRAYPDIAAFATGYQIVYNGATEDVGGTSCSAPTVAGIVALLNDVRLNAGKPTLGHLAPLLYELGKSHPEAFNDIVNGSNPGGIGCPGFKATKGWDPATGWGSPNYGILKGLVLDY